jgi:hypothetical protein
MAKQPRTKDGRFTSKGNGQPTVTNEQAVATALIRYLVQNAQFSRASLSRLTGADNFDSRRSIYDECGFPATRNITIGLLKELHDREPIAARVNELEPDESWKVQPTVMESQDPQDITEFEEAWDDLGQKLRSSELGQESKFQDEEGSPVYKYLRRVDIDSGIGELGALLFGLNDGKQLNEPAAPRKGQELLFLRSLDQSLIEISKFDNDPRSIRYGKPLLGGLGSPNQESAKVHWTRVLHVADNLQGSEVFGVPRCRPVYNNLLNLRKVHHSSPEGYWKVGFPRLSLEAPTGADLEQILPFLSSSVDDAREQIEQSENSLQKVIAAVGLHANQLSPEMVDPSPHVLMQLQAICIKKACPLRIFMGSERGELASSQDERAWASRMVGRQVFYITPDIIVPFVDRLIWLGVLPEPKEGYSVAWPDLNPLTPLDHAEIAGKLTEAMAKFVQGDVEAIITLADWLMRIVGLSQEEANEIVEARMESLDEEGGRLTGQESEEEEEEEDDESIETSS